MSSRSRNPSFTLSTEQTDAIVDRALRGKYEKRPVTQTEWLETGLVSYEHVMRYCTYRWSGELTKAGMTMRQNSLWKKVGDNLNCLTKLSDHRLVWKFYDSVSGNTVCYANGPHDSAVNWVETFFRWTLPKNAKLYANLAGFGGIDQAAVYNTSLLSSIQEHVDANAARAQQYEAIAQRYRQVFDVLAGTASHMTAVADAAKGPMQTE